jgi:hypothetical protein
VNVGEIASAYGGGGHWNAGSITISHGIDELFLSDTEKSDFEWKLSLKEVLSGTEVELEYSVDTLLRWELTGEMNRDDIYERITCIRNGGRYAFSRDEVEVLRLAAQKGYRKDEIYAQFSWRGIPIDLEDTGGGAQTEKDIHQIRMGVQSDGQVVLRLINGGMDDKLLSPEDTWTIVETDYENYFFQTFDGCYKFVDSHEIVTDDFIDELHSVGKWFRPVIFGQDRLTNLRSRTHSTDSLIASA